MPRSREPSAATRWLIGELASRGLKVGYRAVEDWAARGMTPAPVRRSLGRGRGTASEYPPGAVEQYAAVAAVTRRGRPWQISVLKLFVRGHLPSNEDLVRQALHELLIDDVAGQADSSLDYAETYAAHAVAARGAQPFLRAFRRNLRRAIPVLEPGSDIDSVVTGAIATTTLVRLGQPDWTPEAIIEMLATFGLPVAELTDDDRAGLVWFFDSFLVEVMTGPALDEIAVTAPISRLQSAVPAAHQHAARTLAAVGVALPKPSEDFYDALVAFLAVVLIRIEDLGGDQAVAELVQQHLQAAQG